MSPASGDSNYSSSRLALLNDRVSIQLMSPASGDYDNFKEAKVALGLKFPFN